MGKNWLEKALRVERREVPKLLLFALIGALMQAGLSIGQGAGDTLFLVHVGASQLPRIYLLTFGIMLSYGPASAFFLGRFGALWVFCGTLVMLLSGSVAIYFGLASCGNDFSTLPAQILLYAVVLFFGLWNISLFTLYWNFVDNYFDILDAKRVYSLLSAGCAVGGIGGGVIVSWLSSTAGGVPALYLAWAATAGLMIPLLFTVTRSFKSTRDEADEDDGGSQGGILSQFHVLGGAFRGSRYVTGLAAVMFLTQVAATLCDFQYMGIFERGNSEASLARLFGTLYMAANGLILFGNLFVFNRLVSRIGVANTSLVQPAIYISVFVILLVTQEQWAAVWGFMAFQAIQTCIDYNNVNLLQKALPDESRETVRSFTEGLVVPLATAAVGLFLLGAAALVSSEQVSLIGLGATALGLGAVLFTRAEYAPALVRNLKRQWVDFSSGGRAVPLTAEEARLLAARAVEAPQDAEAWDAALLLAVRDPEQGGDLVLRLLAERSGPVPAQDVTRLLLSSRSTSLWGRLAGLAREKPDRLSFLSSEIAARTSGSVDGLRVADRGEWVAAVVEQLDTASDETRREVFAAIRQLAGQGATQFMDALYPFVRNGPPELRREALDTLAALGDSSCVAPLLSFCPSLAPAERRAIENTIVHIGLQTIPITLSVLNHPGHSEVTRALAARIVGRLAPSQLEAIVDEVVRVELRRAWSYRAALRSLEKAAAAGFGFLVLRQLYAEAPGIIVEFVLDLHTILGRLPSTELLAASLRSTSSKERAEAVESIEQGVDHAVFAQILPLVHYDADTHEAWEKFAPPVPTVEDLLRHARASHDPLEQAAGLMAFAEKGSPADVQQALLRASGSPQEVVRAAAFEILAVQKPAELSLGDFASPARLVHDLENTPFFGELRCHELLFLVLTAPRHRVAAGALLYQGGDPPAGVWLVIEGTVLEGGQPRSAAALVGLADVFLPTRRGEAVTATECRLLELSLALFEDCTRRFPRAGVELLRRRVLPLEGSA